MLLAWAQLLKQVGPGKHTFEMRVAPRCVINPEPGEADDDDYSGGKALIDGWAKVGGGGGGGTLNKSADPAVILRANVDNDFIQFCKTNFEGKVLCCLPPHLTTTTDTPPIHPLAHEPPQPYTNHPNRLATSTIPSTPQPLGPNLYHAHTHCPALPISIPQDLYPDPENPMFKATFTLDLDPAICTGKGPQRQCEKFADLFNDDLTEHCLIAYDLASANASRAAKVIGAGSLGKPVHVVLPERAGYQAGGIFNTEDKNEGNHYRHFLACVFWLNPKDNSDDAEGCSSMVGVARFERLSHPVCLKPTSPQSASRFLRRGRPVCYLYSVSHAFVATVTFRSFPASQRCS